MGSEILDRSWNLGQSEMNLFHVDRAFDVDNLREDTKRWLPRRILYPERSDLGSWDWEGPTCFPFTP